MKTLNQTKFIELFFNQTPLNLSENWDTKLFFVISALFFLLTIFLRCDRKKEKDKEVYKVEKKEKNNHKRSSDMIYTEDQFKNIRQFVNHLNYKENILTKQLEIFQKINRIEDLSIQLEDVKEESRCKKRPRLMKKIDNMWKEMSDEEKMMYKD